MKRENRGFSLIELIVAVAILVVLTGLLAPNLLKKIEESRRAKCLAQRDNLTLEYNLAAMENGWENIKDTLELKTELGGKDPIDYMVEKGYCDKKETVCPVYHEKYELEVSEIKGVKSVEFICPCSPTEKGYLALAEKISEKNNKADRKVIIKEIFEERGSLLPVSSKFKDGTIGEDMDLYWRPYYLNNGGEVSVVMYASPSNNDTHADWKAYLVYIDGEIYQSTNGTEKKPQPAGVASFYNSKTTEELKGKMESLNFEKVK